MISLLKTATELDRLEELNRTALECYAQALRSTEQNAIEVDAQQAAQFRKQLEALRDQLRADAGARELSAVQTAFESQLKGYRDSAQEQIQRLRREVQEAASIVETFTVSISDSESLLESGLKRELNSLNQSAKSDDIRQIRDAIQTSTGKIAQSVEQMRSSNQLAIAQLKDEIRVLHQEVQAAKRVQTSGEPQMESNKRMTGRMEDLAKTNATFSVLLVVVRNLEGLQNCFSANVLDSALRGFQARFTNSIPGSATVDRWTKDQFAAILSTAPANAIEMSTDVVRKLSAPFVEQENGSTRSVIFAPRAGVIEYTAGSDMAKFQTRLKQLAEALAT